MRVLGIAVAGLVAVGMLLAPSGDVPYAAAVERGGLARQAAAPSAASMESRLRGLLDGIQWPGPQTTVDEALPNDPYLGRQWGLRQVRLPWELQAGLGSGVLVAVLDTGIDADHEDLSGRVVAEVNFTDSPVNDDVRAHGTPVAGIIAANANNGRGIAGIAPGSLLLNVKVADDEGIARSSAVAEGIRWAVEHGARVINVSMQFTEPSGEMQRAVEYAWKKGALVIAAAGNYGNQLPVYPAFYEKAIAVAASTKSGRLAAQSSFGTWVDVMAPGLGVYSTLPGDSYGYRYGTSYATAYVSGLAALLFSVAVDLNGNGRVNDEVRAAIEAGSLECDGVAAGRVDAAASLGVIGAR